ncbi:hypothetical protein D3C73_1000580 [compost metagenome]
MVRSNLIEPVTSTVSVRAPRSRKRWASASVCTANRLISASIGWVSLGNRP